MSDHNGQAGKEWAATAEVCGAHFNVNIRCKGAATALVCGSPKICDNTSPKGAATASVCGSPDWNNGMGNGNATALVCGLSDALNNIGQNLPGMPGQIRTKGKFGKQAKGNLLKDARHGLSGIQGYKNGYKPGLEAQRVANYICDPGSQFGHNPPEMPVTGGAGQMQKWSKNPYHDR